jgi:hypothetical protein
VPVGADGGGGGGGGGGIVVVGAVAEIPALVACSTIDAAAAAVADRKSVDDAIVSAISPAATVRRTPRGVPRGKSRWVLKVSWAPPGGADTTFGCRTAPCWSPNCYHGTF